MSFGSGLSEKDAIRDVQGTAGQLKGLSGTADTRSGKAFNMFKNAAKPPLQYWNQILSGDTNALNEFLSPEVNRISEAYQAPLRSLSENAPRGGGTASAVGGLQEGQARAMSDLFGKARPEAAKELGGLAGLFGGVSEGFGQQAIGAESAAGVAQMGALGAIEQGRARTSQFWGDIGQTAGQVAGAGFGAGGAWTGK